MYVKREDYRGFITDSLLDMIIEQAKGKGEDILADASKFAEGTILTYTGALFFTQAELVKTGNTRNFLVLMWAINISVYIIYQRIADDQVPEKVIKNYDDTISDLQKVANGKLPLNLPELPVVPSGENESTYSGLKRIGSKPLRSHML